MHQIVQLIAKPRPKKVFRIFTLAWMLAIPLHAESSSPAAADPLLNNFDSSTIDSSINACDDFYQHACGSWLREASIPADKGEVTLQDTTADEAYEKALRYLLEDKGKPDNSDISRLRIFFESCMSPPEQGSKADKEVIASWIRKIQSIGSPGELWPVVYDLHKLGINAFFSFSDQADWSDWSRFQGHIHQGSLGLPYGNYLDSSPDGRKRIDAYKSYVETMLRVAAWKRKVTIKDVESILRIETSLASHSIPWPTIFDPKLTKHPMSLAELERLAPAIPWTKYFAVVGNSQGRAVNVTSPDFLQATGRVLMDEPLEALRIFLLWRWINAMAPYLPSTYADKHYEFAANGNSDKPDRRQQCRIATIKALGVELSKQYSLNFIGPQARDEAKTMASNIQTTISQAMMDVGWLSPESRRVTAQKISLTDLKIGFPDTWPSTGGFPLEKNTFLKNVSAAQSFEQQRSWARAQTLRNRSSWEMKVYPNVAPGMAAARLMISNGFPDVFSNSILMTAAKIQSPRFDSKAPLEVLYGSFGTVVAHELVHVLEFSKFDKTGAPAELWAESDYKAHEGQRSCVAEQAGEYKINGSVALNGIRTMDENVADLSGLKYAYKALTKAVPNFEDPNEKNITPAMRFFYGYAQRWCTKERAEGKLDTTHAPPKYRVNGPLSNLPEFAKAFSCKERSKMVRPVEARCSVW